jgi:hypothetical protein
MNEREMSMFKIRLSDTGDPGPLKFRLHPDTEVGSAFRKLIADEIAKRLLAERESTTKKEE